MHLLNLFEGLDVLKILGYGLSGFAFLLMFFTFLLLRQIINKQGNTPKMIFKLIWAFMAMSFVMTIVIGVFTFLVTDYKQNVLAQNEKTIHDQESNIEVFKTDQKRDSLLSSAIANNAFNDAEKFKKVDEQQQKILDSLSTKVNNSDASPEAKQQFNDLSDSLRVVSSGLTNPDLTTRQKDSLKVKYFEINKRIPNVLMKTMKKAGN